LSTEGYRVFDAEVAGRQAIVGQRRLFRWSWMATQLKVTVVVVDAQTLNAGEWQAVLTKGFDLAKKAPGWPNGFQSGAALIGVVVADSPDSGAVAAAESMPPRQWFKGITSNALLDAGTGKVHTFDERQLVGRVYTTFLRSQRDLAVRAVQGTSS
jgi:hypothetical protein